MTTFMQTLDSGAQYAPSGPDLGQLRRKLEALTASPYLPAEARTQMRNVVLRIDLEMATPTAQVSITELSMFIVQSLRTLKQNQALPTTVEADIQKFLLELQDLQSGTSTDPNANGLMIECRFCGDSHLFKFAHSFARPDLCEYLFPSFQSRTDLSSRILCAPDFMSIDAGRFFVRGILNLPVRSAETPMELGIWAEVEEGQFSKYVDRVLEKLNGKLTDQRSLLLRGRLANRLYCLPELFDHAVEIDCSPKLGQARVTVKSPDPVLKNKIEQGLTVPDLSSTFSRFIHAASA